MGNCRYCGSSVGFLKDVHEECLNRHESGKAEIVSLVGRAGFYGREYTHLKHEIKEIASTSNIDRETIRTCILAGFERAVNASLMTIFYQRKRKKP